MTETSCPFCPDNWHNLRGIGRVWGFLSHDVSVIEPLNPVTQGHVLVISSKHTEDVAATGEYGIAADLMQVAAEYVDNNDLQANIITSIGPLATQTVFHTNLHIVPRRENDGLQLPWTTQDKWPADPQECAALFYSGEFPDESSFCDTCAWRSGEYGPSLWCWCDKTR